MLDIIGILLFLIVILLAVLLAFTERTWISPVSLMIIWIIFFIGGDVAYTYWIGSYGPNEYDREILDQGYLGIASFSWALAVLGFLVGYVILMPVKRSLAHNFFRTREPAQNLLLHSQIAKILVVFAFFLSAIVFLVMINPDVLQGNVLGSIAGVRSKLSDGGGFWLVGLRFVSVALIFCLLIVWAANVRFPTWWFFALLAVLVELGMGSRSGLLYGFMLPLFLGYHILHTKIHVSKLMGAAVLGAILVGVVYRTLVRDVGFRANIGFSVWDILSRNLTRLPEMIWGGFEASSFDATIKTIMIYSEKDYLLGETILAGMSSFIPRLLWSNKPEGGGNAFYTQNFFPDFFWDAGSEYSVSFVGELFMNFGWVGVFVGFLILGAVLRWLYARFVGGYAPTLLGVFGVFIYVITVSRVYSLMRGDLFNFVNQLFVSLSIGLFLFLVIAVGHLVLLSRRGCRESALDFRVTNEKQSGRG